MSEPRTELLGRRLVELRSGLKAVDPGELASRSGMKFKSFTEDSGEFLTRFWDRQVLISFPKLIASDKQSGDLLGDSSQALLLYYLTTCDGTPVAGRWISFSELPDGRFYNQAFQSYTGGKLSQVFRNDFESFRQVSENLGGKRVYLLGDAAYEFKVLPLVDLMAVTWQGDEDFDSTYQILFDEAVKHHLPTDACAILGSNLTRRLSVEMESLNENRH